MNNLFGNNQLPSYNNAIRNRSKRNNTNIRPPNYSYNNGNYNSNVSFASLSRHEALYFIVLIASYFVVKIIYPAFYKLYPNISSSQELINLGTTAILLYIVYNTSGFSNISSIHWFFYLGLIAGLNYPAFYAKVIEPNYHSTVSSQIGQNIFSTIIYIKLVVLMVILLYAGMTTDPSRYLTYFAGMMIIIVGLILTKKGFYFWQERDQSTGKPTSVWNRSAGDIVKFGLSFTSWLLALLFIFPQGSEGTTLLLLLQFAFGAVLGIFIANMSYKGPDYFLETRPEDQCKDKKDCEKKFNIPANLENQDVTDALVSIKWIVIFLILFNIALFTLYWRTVE